MTDEIIPTETLNKTFMLVPHWRIDVDGWTEEACAAHFEKKHGKPPEFVFDRFGYLWLGPINGKEASDA